MDSWHWNTTMTPTRTVTTKKETRTSPRTSCTPAPFLGLLATPLMSFVVPFCFLSWILAPGSISITWGRTQWLQHLLSMDLSHPNAFTYAVSNLSTLANWLLDLPLNHEVNVDLTLAAHRHPRDFTQASTNTQITNHTSYRTKIIIIFSLPSLCLAQSKVFPSTTF